MRHYDPEAANAWLGSLFQSAGLITDEARTVANQLIQAEMRGVHSHGLIMADPYCQRIRSGGIRSNHRLRRLHMFGAFSVYDGDGGPGQVIAERVLLDTVATSRQFGIAYSVLTNSNHVGMLASYGLLAVQQGCLAVILTNSGPSTCAFGGVGKQMGNNAMCVAAPSADGKPFVFDIATGLIACGKIRYAAFTGDALSEGSFVMADGTNGSDPASFDNGGFVPPFGGHKGYGLAASIDVLTALLAGGLLSLDVRRQRSNLEKPMSCCQSFMVIDVRSVGPQNDFATRVAEFTTRLRALDPADAMHPIIAPGDPESSAEARARETGIEVPASLVAQLDRLATAFCVSPFSNVTTLSEFLR